MFVEISSEGQISAVYVEQQYPDQKWVPPSSEALQAFLGDAPKLGKDAKGRTCLLPAPILPLPKEKIGIITAILLGVFSAVFFSGLFLLLKKAYSNIIS